MCQRKNERLSDIGHGSITQLKTLQLKKQKLHQRYMQRKTNDNEKRFNRIRNLLQKRLLKKERNFY